MLSAVDNRCYKRILYEVFIGKYLSSLGKLDDIVAPEEGFEAQL